MNADKRRFVTGESHISAIIFPMFQYQSNTAPPSSLFSLIPAGVIAGYGRGGVMGMVVSVDEIVFIQADGTRMT